MTNKVNDENKAMLLADIRQEMSWSDIKAKYYLTNEHLVDLIDSLIDDELLWMMEVEYLDQRWGSSHKNKQNIQSPKPSDDRTIKGIFKRLWNFYGSHKTLIKISAFSGIGCVMAPFFIILHIIIAIVIIIAAPIIWLLHKIELLTLVGFILWYRDITTEKDESKKE